MNPTPPRRPAWIEILRPPNLFTVPGDPVAGFFLASCGVLLNGSAVVVPAAVALLAYVSGLVGNDVADFRVDAAERPERPLPSGRVSRPAAVVAMAVAAAAAVGVSLLGGWRLCAAACALLAAVFLYNFALKTRAVLGPLAMGLCRGLSFLMGAVATGWTPVPTDRIPACAVGLLLYVAAVTWIARDETAPANLAVRRWIPAAALAALFLAAYFAWRPCSLRFPVTAVAAVFWALFQATRLRGTAPAAVTRSAVGNLLRNLIFVQAALLFLLDARTANTAAAALLLLWPLNAWTARRFYAS